MRALIQRVSESAVKVNGHEKGKTGKGLVILLGIEDADDQSDIQWLAAKIARLRIFEDENGVMNLSVMDVDGDLMIVSQFTLHASTKKGNRPSYIKSAKPDISQPLYQDFVNEMEKITSKKVATGEFGAHMQIALVNDGPVTIWIDSKNRE